MEFYKSIYDIKSWHTYILEIRNKCISSSFLTSGSVLCRCCWWCACRCSPLLSGRRWNLRRCHLGRAEGSGQTSSCSIPERASGCFQWDINLFFYLLFPHLQSVLIWHVLHAMFSGKYPAGDTHTAQLPGLLFCRLPLWLSFLLTGMLCFHSNISSVICSLCLFLPFR